MQPLPLIGQLELSESAQPITGRCHSKSRCQTQTTNIVCLKCDSASRCLLRDCEISANLCLTFVSSSIVSILYTNSPRVHARLVHQPERLVQVIVVEAGEAGQVQQQQAQRVQAQAELRQLHHLE